VPPERTSTSSPSTWAVLALDPKGLGETAGSRTRVTNPDEPNQNHTSYLIPHKPLFSGSIIEFSRNECTEGLKKNGIQISMDGKDRWKKTFMS